MNTVSVWQTLKPWLMPGMRLGVGAGRTVAALVPHLAELHREGWPVQAVAASEATAQLLRALNIPLLEESSLHVNPLSGDFPIDLLLDGADEVDPQLQLIKGYGGALTREKVLARSAKRRVYVITPDKRVPILGTRGRLPVEILRFGWWWTKRLVETALHTTAEVRLGPDGTPWVSDNGQFLLDVHIGPLTDPEAVERTLKAIPGVLEVGIFLGYADQVLVVKDEGVEILTRTG
jgi:ribose 5-phosphate isomerase A